MLFSTKETSVTDVGGTISEKLQVISYHRVSVCGKGDEFLNTYEEILLSYDFIKSLRFFHKGPPSSILV